LRIELPTLVVETVRKFVADDDADAAHVHWVIHFPVEKGRLQDSGREDDLVARATVVA